MYIKWIVCNVKKELKKEFSKAQEKWISTQKAEGFIGQVGGWEVKNENMAYIISFWENKKSLECFMKKSHDKILFDSNQPDTYESISVVHFESVLEMEGSAGSLKDAIKLGKLLRVADCLVKFNRTKHFEKMQKTVWLPGMKKSEGMLGGLFSKAESNIPRYLVSTFWDSIEHHNNYVINKLPIFQSESKVEEDIDVIIGIQVLLKDAWRIMPKNEDEI